VSIFLALKVVHVLAAITAVGTSVTSVFWLDRAGLDPGRLVWALDGASRLERRVANPAYVVLLLTGIVMVSSGGYRFDQGWIATAIVLYVFIAAFGVLVFAPAVRRQRAEAATDPSSERYARLARRTRRYSWLTTGIVVLIVILMVAKPF
jgi:uncharacterized membrane protein